MATHVAKILASNPFKSGSKKWKILLPQNVALLHSWHSASMLAAPSSMFEISATALHTWGQHSLSLSVQSPSTDKRCEYHSLARTAAAMKPQKPLRSGSKERAKPSTSS